MPRREPVSSVLSEQDGPKTATWLVLVGSASAPLRPPRVLALDDVAALELGREDPDHPARPGRVTVEDRWMSARHAEILRSAEGWRLSDLGSSNGTLVWGRRRSTHLLADGDVFETGSTFWMFRSVALSRPVPAGPEGRGALASVSPVVAELNDKLVKVAKSRIPLILQGSTGTGKEVLAHAAHEVSGRPGPLVALDVGTVPRTMVAPELFGVESSPDGVERPRAGRLRAAHGGTVLLDQLGDMPGEVQLALLRVLQSGVVVPVGSDEPKAVDIRFIGTTHEDIDALVEARVFRADLWSRLKGFVLHLPTLRERLEDLGLLLARFLERLGLEHLTYTPAAYRALLAYPWPHNIRELEQAVASSAALSDGRRVELTDLPQEIQSHRPPEAKEARISEESRERELVRLLTAHRGNVSAVARSMGYSRMQVHRWMKQMNVDPNAFRT